MPRSLMSGVSELCTSVRCCCYQTHATPCLLEPRCCKCRRYHARYDLLHLLLLSQQGVTLLEDVAFLAAKACRRAAATCKHGTVTTMKVPPTRMHKPHWMHATQLSKVS